MFNVQKVTSSRDEMQNDFHSMCGYSHTVLNPFFFGKHIMNNYSTIKKSSLLRPHYMCAVKAVKEIVELKLKTDRVI